MHPLRRAREAAELTQVELAQRAETDQGSISRIEGGTQGVSPELAERLVRVLKQTGLTELQLLYPERSGLRAPQRTRQRAAA